MSSCTFTNGASTVATYCEDGCCSDSCCSDELTDGALIGIIIAAVIGGLLLLLLIALCLWCLLRKKNKDGDKKPITKKKKVTDMEAGKKKNMLVSNPPPSSNMNKKPRPPPKTTGYGEKNKMTQTINHRAQPGDIILKPRANFVSATGEQKAYQDYLRSNKSFEVGTCTDGKDAIPHEPRKHNRLNSTANFYTRRDSLKGSSDEDDNLPSFRATQTPGSQNGVLVNMYGYAARDFSKTDYHITDEKEKAKVQNVVGAWQAARWQPHMKPVENQSPVQKRWK